MSRRRPRARFADFEIDLETGELWRSPTGGEREAVHLPPQAARLLVLLVDRAGRLVERQAIRDALWGDRWVDWESGLHQAVRRLRKTLGDDHEPRCFIETAARRGYRFVAPVALVAPAETESDPVAGTPGRAGAPLRGHLVSLAALLLAVAVAATAGWLASGGPEVPGEGGDAAPAAAPAEARRLYEEALHLAARGDARQALQRLELAAERAPSWSAPWSAIAELWLDSTPAAGARASGGDKRIVEARSAIEKALVRDAGDARAWRTLGRLRLWEEWDWIGGRGALERAVELEPGHADGWQLLAALETVTGREESAIAAARRAVELDPVSTVRRADLGWTLYYFARSDEALAECRRGLEIDPRSASAAQCLLQARLLAARRRGEPVPQQVVAQFARQRQSEPQATAGASCVERASEALPLLLSGDSAGAVDALVDGAAEGRGWALPFALVDPLLSPIASHPRLASVRAALAAGPS